MWKPSLKKIKGAVNINIFILLLLALLAILFEYLPFIDQGRRLFPHDYRELSCKDILQMRPWYSQINQWLWLWLFGTPLILFSIEPCVNRTYKAIWAVLVTILSYGTIVLATSEAYEIINLPFLGEGIINDSTTNEVKRYALERNCYNDGGGIVLSLIAVFGWIPAIIYTGWWGILWSSYHRRITKKVDRHFKQDWVSSIIIWASIILPFFIAGYIVYGFFIYKI